MVVVYLKGGSAIVCQGYSKCPTTDMLRLDLPYGVVDNIVPNTTAKYILIWSECVDKIYVGEKTNPKAGKKKGKDSKH
ncbi:MAG TPA: hypothetical protein EYN67_06690 [Flavobacteriales bacterium]|nr:hypothetical protein [Flavobacteriales bacterium]